MMMSNAPQSQQLNCFNHIDSILDRNPDCEIISVNDSTHGLEIQLAIADRGPNVSIFFDSFRGYRSFDESDLYSYFRTLNPAIRSGIYVGTNTEFLDWAKKAATDPESYKGLRHYIIASANWVVEVLASDDDIRVSK